jgi:hypothetical protein
MDLNPDSVHDSDDDFEGLSKMKKIRKKMNKSVAV